MQPQHQLESAEIITPLIACGTRPTRTANRSQSENEERLDFTSLGRQENLKQGSFDSQDLREQQQRANRSVADSNPVPKDEEERKSADFVSAGSGRNPESDKENLFSRQADSFCLFLFRLIATRQHKVN